MSEQRVVINLAVIASALTDATTVNAAGDLSLGCSLQLCASARAAHPRRVPELPGAYAEQDCAQTEPHVPQGGRVR